MVKSRFKSHLKFFSDNLICIRLRLSVHVCQMDRTARGVTFIMQWVAVRACSNLRCVPSPRWEYKAPECWETASTDATIISSDPPALVYSQPLTFLSSGEPLSFKILDHIRQNASKKNIETFKIEKNQIFGSSVELVMSLCKKKKESNLYMINGELRLKSYRAVGKEIKSTSSSRWRNNCNGPIWDEDKLTLAFWLMREIYSL